MNQRVIITSRRRIEAKIEELIGLLDLLDGDPDIEANGDELDVGMPEGWHYSALSSWDGRQSLPLEDDEDGHDAEPEETDENGDEQDSSRSEDDHVGGGWFAMGKMEGGSGL